MYPTLICCAPRDQAIVWPRPHRPVNSSIIWCPSCLIKHIIDHPSTNDSNPISHESAVFGRTTTWPLPWINWPQVRGQSASAVQRADTPPDGARTSRDAALPKNSWREKCNYRKIIILPPFDFSDWIHEFIWIHLASQSGNPPHDYIWLLAFSLTAQRLLPHEDSSCKKVCISKNPHFFAAWIFKLTQTNVFSRT